MVTRASSRGCRIKANHGNMRKVSKGTFLIVPHGVDMMGEMILDDFDEGKMYF